MVSYGHRHLRQILDELEAYSKVQTEAVKDDLKSLVIEVLSFLKQNVDIADLDSRLMAVAAVDKDDLSSMLRAAKKLKLAAVKIPNLTIEPLKTLKEFEKFVSSVVSQAPLADARDLALSLDFVGDRMFAEILLCASQKGTSVRSIKRMVLKKLEQVPDQVVLTLWDRIVKEFDENRRAQPMLKDPGVLPTKYLNSEGAKRTREKIAQYMLELKPRLILSMFGKGIYRYPVEAAGAVRILALQKEGVGANVSEGDVLLARALSGLAYLWENALFQDISILCNILGIRKGGRILSGPDFKNVKVGAADKQAMLFWELKKVLHIADAVIASELPVERALLQYKLGLEVMCPEVIGEITKKNELLLQKELCRFLLERGIFAVGTKFGRSETDLLVEDSVIDCVIETKKYQTGDTLSEYSIRKDLAQLQSYLDQSTTARRGILVVYNMTDCLLDAPKRWLHHRYWVLAINLQAQPPSHRRTTLSVEQDEDGNLIKTVTNDARKRRTNRKVEPKSKSKTRERS